VEDWRCSSPARALEAFADLDCVGKHALDTIESRDHIARSGWVGVRVLYRRTVNLYRSFVELGWLAQETTGLYWFGPPRSNTLRPVSSFRVPELGVFVVGVTNWSGEGVGPKSL
jgi:hypothetical protein